MGAYMLVQHESDAVPVTRHQSATVSVSLSGAHEDGRNDEQPPSLLDSAHIFTKISLTPRALRAGLRISRIRRKLRMMDHMRPVHSVYWGHPVVQPKREVLV